MKKPITLYKGDAEYTVDTEESLEYHLLQGWSTTRPEPVEAPAPPPSLDSLAAEVAALRAELAEMRVVVESVNPKLIEGYGVLLSKLTTEVNKVTKHLGINPKAPKG